MRRAKAILGRARHDRRRAVSICESWRSMKLVKVSQIFSTVCSTDYIHSVIEARRTGDRNNLKPPLVTEIPEGRHLLKTAEICPFSNNPRRWPSASIISKVARRSVVEPQRVPSSRNQVLIRRSGTFGLFDNGEQNPGAPRGRLAAHHSN